MADIDGHGRGGPSSGLWLLELVAGLVIGGRTIAPRELGRMVLRGIALNALVQGALGGNNREYSGRYTVTADQTPAGRTATAAPSTLVALEAQGKLADQLTTWPAVPLPSPSRSPEAKPTRLTCCSPRSLSEISATRCRAGHGAVVIGRCSSRAGS